MINVEDLQLDRDELNFLVGKIFVEKELSKRLKNIFAATQADEYIADWMDPYIHAILKARPHIRDIGNMLEAELVTNARKLKRINPPFVWS